ncbi:MAG: DUF885 domain-containing protein [Micromonosporaceae bacterium]
MTDQKLAALAADHFAAMMSAEPFWATMFGVPGYDALAPDRSREAATTRLATIDALSGRLDGIDAAGLSDTDQITYSMLRRELTDERDQLAAGLLEVSVSAGVAGALSEVLAAVPTVTITGAEAAEAYLSRLGNLAGFFDGLLERHRQAVADGRTPTALGVRQAIEQVDGYLAAPDADPLLRPAPPAGVDADAWRARIGHVLTDALHPALRRYRDGLASALLPVGRDEEHVGVCHVPGGPEGYLAAVRGHTTTELTPDEIHQLGLTFVTELRGEFAELGGRALGTDDVPEVLRRLREDPALRFETAEQIVDTARVALARAEEALPEWFHSYPTAPCEVREMHPSEAKGGVLGYYMPPAGDGSRPGLHVINTYAPQTRPRFEYEALAFHESVPGHHTQIAISQTLTDLPDFRRFGFVTAHGEGWGLYSERLGEEMGLYTSDLARLGMVSFDAWRACRLVVDTGMHHLGWSRTQAIEFMRDNTALSESNIVNEVDRYIAMPGQALAYLVGRIRIRQLRERARQALGTSFDIRDFHHQVLGHGPLPLDTLGDVVDRWVARGGKDAGVPA